MTTPPTEEQLPRGLTLNFLDGRLHAVPDARLGRYSALYHEASATILYGGMLSVVPEGWSYDQRLIATPDSRASMIARFSAVVDNWDLLRDGEDVPEDLKVLARLHQAGPKFAKTPISYRPGTVFHKMPIGPWSADAEGIYDARGVKVYQRIANQPGAAPAPLSASLPEPEAEPEVVLDAPPTKPSGGGLMSMFRFERRKKDS